MTVGQRKEVIELASSSILLRQSSKFCQSAQSSLSKPLVSVLLGITHVHPNHKWWLLNSFVASTIRCKGDNYFLILANTWQSHKASDVCFCFVLFLKLIAIFCPVNKADQFNPI